jgi:lipopolysaccharide transport protein LptA
MQVHNKTILCREPLTLKKNDEYFVRNKSQPFEVLQSYWFDHAKKICDSTKECNFISGKKLTITLDKERQVKTLVMESKDGDLSQFYTYPLDTDNDYSSTKMITRGPLTGVSEDIIYDVQKKQMQLIKKVRVIQHGNNYKGEKITYYMDRDLVTIPGSTYKRSKIVLDGVAKQTHMDTGLTDISDYDKKNKSKQGFTAGPNVDAANTFADSAVNNNPNIQNGSFVQQ